MSCKFIQPVSMRVTKEQYERDLRKPLLVMGYKEVVIEKWEDLPILVTNLGSTRHHLSNTTESLKTNHNRYFIPDYNPKMLLAIAAMTDNIYGAYGEYWMCIADVFMDETGTKEYDKGKLYMGSDNQRIISNSDFHSHYWYRTAERFRYFRKATLEELVYEFSTMNTEENDIEQYESEVMDKYMREPKSEEIPPFETNEDRYNLIKDKIDRLHINNTPVEKEKVDGMPLYRIENIIIAYYPSGGEDIYKVLINGEVLLSGEWAEKMYEYIKSIKTKQIINYLSK